MDGRISEADLDRIFAQARTHSAWRDRPVPDALLHEVYEAMKWGPTSANCAPARILFLRTPEAKQRLLPALSAGNTDKTMSAPVVAIIAYDTKFYDQLPKLFPQADARAWFAHAPDVAEATAHRNSALQGAYLMLAARALGLDCGPMSGFDQAAVEREFFPDGDFKVNFLCNLGYGDASKLHPRNPRLTFDEACKLL